MSNTRTAQERRGRGDNSRPWTPDDATTHSGNGTGMPDESKMPDETITPALPIMTLTQLRNQPPMEPLIEGVYNMGTLNMMSGAYSSGKSYLALDQALCIATGTNWHEHKVTQGKVLYIAAEGSRALALRCAAWEKVNGVPIPDEFFHVLAQPVQLHTSEGEELQQACADGKYILVVTDTQARCTVGVNENDNMAMGVVAEQLTVISKESGAAVLVVHHDPKVGILRGATAIPGASDTILLTRKSGGIFTLSVHKQKDMASDMPDMHFELEIAGIEDEFGRPLTDKFGNPVTNAAMVETENVGPDLEHGKQRGALIDLYNQDPRPSYEAMAKVIGINKSNISRRIKALRKEGVIQ